MNKKMNNYRLIILCSAIFFYSCASNHNDKKNKQFFDGHGITTMSTDTAELAKFIKLTSYKPIRVQFEYTTIDNSNNDRLTIPGPSDFYLNALLYFDDTTFSRLKANLDSANYASPGYIPLDFYTSWLSDDIRDELLKSDTNYHGHPDYYFTLGKPGKLWLLKNKLLLIESTD